MRQVRVRLRTPTEDGDAEVEILTNLPAKVSATKVAEIYLKRWTIEGAFHELTVALNCEVNTLGYPKAALFGFCVAVAAYNVLAVLKAALRAVHGETESPGGRVGLLHGAGVGDGVRGDDDRAARVGVGGVRSDAQPGIGRLPPRMGGQDQPGEDQEGAAPEAHEDRDPDGSRTRAHMFRRPGCSTRRGRLVRR